VLLIEFCDGQLALGSKRRTKFQLDFFADLGSERIGKRWVIQQFSMSEPAVCKTRTGCDCKGLQRKIRTNARETQNKE